MTPEVLFPLGWKHYLAGGLLIGLGVSALYVTTGLIGSISSFFSSTLSWVSRAPFLQQARFVSARAWRLVYAIGLVAGALACSVLLGERVPVTSIPLWQLAIGGFIAGFGARLSSGCTSGHGICGMALLQVPSILAVLIFLTTAMLTAHLVRALGGA
ncbi:MAG TPA: YeeE/YedE thiosulfate transporter family protein [Usitatibacteraceae bacterium]|nr:YeeE/YedE thiosulfate transporter family protein [Usitatibacteraceae bacterium]